MRFCVLALILTVAHYAAAQSEEPATTILDATEEAIKTDDNGSDAVAGLEGSEDAETEAPEAAQETATESASTPIAAVKDEDAEAEVTDVTESLALSEEAGSSDATATEEAASEVPGDVDGKTDETTEEAAGSDDGTTATGAVEETDQLGELEDMVQEVIGDSISFWKHVGDWFGSFFDSVTGWFS